IIFTFACRQQKDNPSGASFSPDISPNADLLAPGRGLVGVLATGGLVVLRRKEHARSQGLGTSQHLASVDGDQTSSNPNSLQPAPTLPFGQFRSVLVKYAG